MRIDGIGQGRREVGEQPHRAGSGRRNGRAAPRTRRLPATKRRLSRTTDPGTDRRRRRLRLHVTPAPRRRGRVSRCPRRAASGDPAADRHRVEAELRRHPGREGQLLAKRREQPRIADHRVTVREAGNADLRPARCQARRSRAGARRAVLGSRRASSRRRPPRTRGRLRRRPGGRAGRAARHDPRPCARRDAGPPGIRVAGGSIAEVDGRIQALLAGVPVTETRAPAGRNEIFS